MYHLSLTHVVTNAGQQRMLDRNSQKAFQEFSRYAYNQFRMHIVILAGYRDHRGASATVFVSRTNSVPPSHDINDQLGVTSFKGQYENLEENPFIEDFATWITECFSNIFLFLFSMKYTDSSFHRRAL